MLAKKKKIVPFALSCLACACSISGCGIVDLTDSQTKVIANYAADVLIRYDASYYEHFAEEKIIIKDNTADAEGQVATPTPEPTVEPTVEPAITQEPQPTLDSSGIAEGSVANAGISPIELGNIFGAKDVEIAYKGVSETDKYPLVQDDQLAFQITATDKNKLLVFTFDILNVADEARGCNIIGQNIKFKVLINDTDNLLVQKTLLLDDLSQMNVILQPRESRQAVIVCQVPQDYSPDIQSLSLVVRTGGEDKTVKLK